jgi:hypothetical protein
MKTSTKVALLAGGVLAVGAVAAVLSKVSGTGEGYLLQIQASEGGTTEPAPTPSGIFKKPGEIVTIKAKPNSGYTVGTWILDGAEIGQQDSIQVTMNMDHYVVVTFWEGGQPPASYPVAITNLNTVTAWGRFGGIVELGLLNTVSNVVVSPINLSDTPGSMSEYPMKFKVVDSAGRGVPNVPVDLWVDMVPDNSKYKGYLALNMALYTSGNRLRLTTDENGIVTVNIGYMYGIADDMLKLCQDSDLGIWVLFGVLPARLIVHNGLSAPTGIFVTKDGGGKTGERAAMGNFFLNTVRAQIPNTSVPATQGLVYCGFEVKWL